MSPVADAFLGFLREGAGPTIKRNCWPLLSFRARLSPLLRMVLVSISIRGSSPLA